ncbi:hypothetical protein [Microbacterium caowuchunii]|uniref:Excreted virulence factor EspC, type VII ESX diderm n=1 Tax=Microbacterium caowuchunii TaxID=2614638 RepID=A0A5N0TP00_9MICO|nr:hypothetical protein [Microbacterium caowuchunii]KAA9136211.1 hypothetical protein F6B40_00070 [Microbacterium caowuchunii]
MSSSDIYIDRDNMERRIRGIVGHVDALDKALRDIPGPADGGPASALLGFIAAAGAEAANEYGGAVRLIGAITVDVLKDISATEAEITDHLVDLKAELGD